MTADKLNYYASLPLSERVVSSVLEVPHVINYLRRPHDAKKQYNPSDVLMQAINAADDPNIFSLGGNLVMGEEIGSGYSFDVYRFTSSGREWVLKIGKKDTPVRGYLKPSSIKYVDNYHRGLQTLKTTFSEALPNLLPEPHYAFYVNLPEGGKTCIIEPYLDNLIGFNQISNLNSRERNQILGELELFYKGCEIMRRESGLIPDVYRLSNFCVRRIGNQVHLVLLDRELTDRNAPSPVFNFMNRIKYHLRLNQERRRFSK